MTATPDAPPAIITLTPWAYKEAILIAVVASLVFALIEIPSRAKTTSFRAILVAPAFFYWVILAFGNTVTTLLASLSVTKLPSSLADFYFLLSAFFGLFGFQTILKNTNITMFDKGVLTIQDWIDKALNAAAAAAIDRQEMLKQQEETRLIAKLIQESNRDINARVLTKLGNGKVEALDAAAKSSGANPKLYKVSQLVTVLSPSERAALLREPVREPASVQEMPITNQMLAEQAEEALSKENNEEEKNTWSERLTDALRVNPINWQLARVKAFYDVGFHNRIDDAVNTITEYSLGKDNSGQIDDDYADALFHLACYKRRIVGRLATATKDYTEVVEVLRKAIALRPEIRSWIDTDPDFRILKNNAEFLAKLDAPVVPHPM